MAGGTFRGGKGSQWDLGPILQQMSIDLRSKVEGLPDAMREVLSEESDNMADDIRHYIRTRRARTSPPHGRIRTGAMIDSVGTNESGGATQFTVQVGYLKDAPHWAELQEYGFHHVGADVDVPGTEALTDSYIRGRERITERLDRLGTRRKY